MNYGDDHNPYAPPTQIDPGPSQQWSYEREFQFPAERGDRFVARLLDGILATICIVPWVIFLIALDAMDFGSIKDDKLATLKLLPGALPLAIYQWNLVTRTGQTLGKKWLNIKIVKVDGSPVDFTSGVVLRDWVINAIGFIPCVGPLIELVGILMIFSDDRRCLHDRIAGTMVVKTGGQ